MSLEQAIEKLTAAVEANTAQIAVSRPSPPDVPYQAAVAQVLVDKKGLGRPKKVETPAPVVVAEPEIEAANDDNFLDDEPEAPASVVKLTKDDVRAALVGLQKTTGRPEASRGILKQFKAETLGSLKESDYAAVIAAAKKAA